MARRRKNSSTATSVVSSAMSSRMPSGAPSRAASPARTPGKAFRFFDLPSELRLRVYEFSLLMPEPLDLHPLNHRLIHPRLSLFLVSRRMHEEAYPVFYSQTIRLFPYHGRFFHDKHALLARLSPRYRNVVTTIELRLGPGWTRPPRSQHTKPSLGLSDCTSLRVLKIFVECDPSDDFFNGFRGKDSNENTYKYFSVNLLLGIISQVPSLEAVEIDANPGIKKTSPLVVALRDKVQEHGKRLVWGPLRGWDKERSEPDMIGMGHAFAAMAISDVPAAVPARVIEVQA